MRFSVSIDVMPKDGISDPQGQTIEQALPTLGLEGIRRVRVGKRIELTLEAVDEGAARSIVDEACHRFLANPVIEQFEVSLIPATGH
ncbi:MAG: phosphoribosylformylglycinamidine synthase subunit PurS [Actinomycetota bacterium]